MSSGSFLTSARPPAISVDRRRSVPSASVRRAIKRTVTQIAFKPDWTREGKAAPFKRNDRMLDVLPIGLVVFPGSGITDNLADKAKNLGTHVMHYRKRGA